MQFFETLENDQGAFGVSYGIEVLVEVIVEVDVQISDGSTKIVQIFVDLLATLIEIIVVFLLHRADDHVEFKVEWRETLDRRFSQR